MLSYREGLLLPGDICVPVTPVVEKLLFLTVIDPHDLSAGGLDEVLELTELIHSLKRVFLQGIPEMRNNKHRKACAGWRRGRQKHSMHMYGVLFFFAFFFFELIIFKTTQL